MRIKEIKENAEFKNAVNNITNSFAAGRNVLKIGHIDDNIEVILRQLADRASEIDLPAEKYGHYAFAAVDSSLQPNGPGYYLGIAVCKYSEENNRLSYEIEILLTAPKSKGCGKALIEFIANNAKFLKIRLEPIKGTEKFYIRMGFKKSYNSNRMEIDFRPFIVDKWENYMGKRMLKETKIQLEIDNEDCDIKNGEEDLANLRGYQIPAFINMNIPNFNGNPSLLSHRSQYK